MDSLRPVWKNTRTAASAMAVSKERRGPAAEHDQPPAERQPRARIGAMSRSASGERIPGVPDAHSLSPCSFFSAFLGKTMLLVITAIRSSGAFGPMSLLESWVTFSEEYGEPCWRVPRMVIPRKQSFRPARNTTVCGRFHSIWAWFKGNY